VSALEWCVVALFAFYVVFAIDDLVVDVTYWFGRLIGKFKRPVVRYEQLRAVTEWRVAIVTPAWREHDVIARMLLYNLPRIDYQRFDYWVGTYPNDQATQAEVDRVRAVHPNVRKVVTDREGPTSKADCLNAVLRAIAEHERAEGIRYDFLLFHDAEDLIHPLELLLLNAYFHAEPDVDFVQLPVLSTPPRWYDFVAGTYIDEFAEMYFKNMHVRQWLTGFVPSAGVATGVRRSVIDQLMEERNGVPLATNSLTEDYDLGLGLAVGGRRTRYLMQQVRVRDEKERADQLVATWAPFPHTFRTAVRQRTRWMAGIVYQGWEHWGWPRGLGLKWILAHDRRGPLGYVVVLAGYVLLLFLIGRTWIRTFMDPTLPEVLGEPWVGVIFWIGLFFMLNRLLQRALAVDSLYGIRQALLAVVRTPFSNLVNMTAALRATGQYFRSRATGIPMSWDKTEHSLPPEVRATMRLGEVLIEERRITTQQLVRALREQRNTGEQLGTILVQQGAVTRDDLETLIKERRG
jgi:adsorption protein B